MFGFKLTENVETAGIRQGDLQDNHIAGGLYVFAIRLLRVAEEDLRGIIAYIALDNPSAAAAFADKIENRLSSLSSYPLLGKIPDEDELASPPENDQVLFYLKGFMFDHWVNPSIWKLRIRKSPPCLAPNIEVSQVEPPG